MKFSINKTELQNALAIVMKGVTTRSTLPVLSGILVMTEQDSLSLRSSDLQLSIQIKVPALIEEEGSTVVPGKLFTDIVKSLPDAAINFTADDGQAQLTCDTSAFSVRTLNAEDFPGFPSVSPTQTIKLPFGVFSDMVRRVSDVVSRDESRAILTGVLVETEGSKLRMVATDSYRLALAETEIDSDAYDGDQDFQAVIAGVFLKDIANLSVPEDTITIGIAENQIIVDANNIVFINRRIEGQYPNYKQLLPDNYSTRAKFPVDMLNSAIKRASILSSSTAPVKFTLEPDVNLVQITVNSSEVGSVQESIDCPVEGEQAEIAFNTNYVQNCLTTIKDPEIYFDIQGSLKPGIFKSTGEEVYLYLIMPVRL